MAVAARVYLYGIALVALGMFITGAAGLLALVIEVIVQSIGGLPATIGDSQVRSRASLSGALTVIGLLAWTSHWWLADQATHRAGEAGAVERRSAIRKLFLYLALFVGGLILVIAGSAFLAGWQHAFVVVIGLAAAAALVTLLVRPRVPVIELEEVG